MKTIPALLALAAAISFAPPARSQFIHVTISYKVILNPANGQWPSGVNGATLTNAVNSMNNLLAGYYRGYRFRMSEPPVEIGGQGDATGPSRWFSTDLEAVPGAPSSLQSAAQSDSRYAWRNDVFNVYVNEATTSGVRAGGGIICVGQRYAGDGTIILHEFSHEFGLSHTHGTSCDFVCGFGSPPDCVNHVSGDDGISDTLADASCWDKNRIAQNAFGGSYNGLPQVQKDQVDDTFNNVMSYHIYTSRVRMTELQVDRWADTAAGRPLSKVSGTTRFVDRLNTGIGTGRSIAPFATVAAGITAATAGDIVLIRPGAYDEPMTIAKAITLRATRRGAIAIGTTVAP